MKIIIDLILCIIIALGAVLGIKFGFVKMASKPVKFVATLLIAFSTAGFFADAVVTPLIAPSVTGYISDFVYENCAGLTVDNVAEELPTLLKIAAALSGVDVTEVAGASGGSVVESIIEALTMPVIGIIAMIISFIAVYIIAKILLSLLLFLINLLFERGILGIFNRLLGFIFATGFAIIIAWGLAVVLELIFHLPAFETNAAVRDFEGGFFYRFFNTYNPIELLLSF